MSPTTIRGWSLVHRWSSLVCTAFLLMLCVTGLPLIFHDEIDAASGHGLGAIAGPGSSGEGAGLRSLDTMLAMARAARPGEVPLFMGFDDARPVLTVTTGPRPDAPARAMHLQLFNRATGTAIAPQAASQGRGEHGTIINFLLQLHTDMFLGLGGEVFLAAMGLLFVVALVSGVVLYAPFMRKLAFGTLRTRRSARIHWLDWHNLVGIVALAWMAVVGVTGAINACVTPITKMWQASELAAMTRAYAQSAPLAPAHYGALDPAMAAARRAVPGMRPRFIAFPGGAFSSAHHYGIYFQGNTPLTEHLLTIALVDAGTGRVTAARPMPWYFRALSLSRPLHFGDYGGLPLKLLWAALDVLTIVVLASGLYLWVARRGGAGAMSPRLLAAAAIATAR